MEVDLPPALRLTPEPLLKVTGNSLLRGVLNRIKNRLLNQLSQDYHQWVDSQSQSGDIVPTHDETLLPTESVRLHF